MQRVSVLGFLSAACLLAQNAQISGVVKDSSSAVLPHATVTALNSNTGAVRTTTSNSEGLYTIVSLTPGPYQVKASAGGFQVAEFNNVILEVAQDARLDFTLEVGHSEQTVTVTAEAPSLNVTDGAVGMAVGPEMVDNLPLNGRSFQQLITLSPGVNLAPGGSDGQFIVNGQRATSNYFTVDGVSANIGVTGGIPGSSSNAAGGTTLGGNAIGGTNSLVSVDALQEFRILTSSFSPEYGRTPGGQMILLTRSGTNAFHGTLFEYFRNDKLDATEWFVNQQAGTKPALRSNDFGGTFAGPIVRNKTFFFSSYEGQRLRQPLFAVDVVPDLASRLAAPAATQPILNAYPLPTGPSLGKTGAQAGQAVFAGGYSNPSTTDAISLKLDQVLGSRLTIFGRYSYAPSESVGRAGSPNSMSVLIQRPTHAQTLTLGATWVINARMVNELRFNLSDNSYRGVYKIDNFGGAVALPNSYYIPGLAYGNALEQFTLTFAGSQLFSGTSGGNEQRQANLTDSLSYVAGAHQFKLGADDRVLLPYAPVAQGVYYTFCGVPSVISNTASSVRLRSQERVRSDLTNFSLYAQDTWHLTQRLTVTYGFRWEVNTPPHSLDASNGDYVPLVGNLADPATLHAGTVGSPLWNTQYANLAPRAGVAYQLRRTSGWETVLRAGAGKFYDLGTGVAALNTWTQSYPGNLVGTATNVSLPVNPATLSLPGLNFTLPPSGQTFYIWPADYKLPRTWQWNTAVQQSLGRAQTLTVSYVAALGRDLVYGQSYLNLTSQKYHVVYSNNAGTSNYQALQVQFQRRLSHGLSAILGYTWGHSLDVSSADLTALPSTGFVGNSSNKGPSDFDIRHNLSTAFTWALPGATRQSWLRTMTRGWDLNAIIVARSPFPVDITSSHDVGFGNFALRPDLVPDVPLYLNNPDVPGGRKINIAAFSVPSNRQGDLGRNALRGFDLSQTDLAVGRTFRLNERFQLLFRGELYNVLNHPNFANPIGDLGNALFGQSTAMAKDQIGGGSSTSGAQSFGLNGLFQVGGPRSVQLSLKLRF
jgi:hypothetical protein